MILAGLENSMMHRKDEAFQDIERMIVNGELKPGQWVSETDLIEVSGHTRAPVRSAIQKLSDEGLLLIAPRRGAQIIPIDHTEQFRALELRRAVEMLIGRSAAKRSNSLQRASFTKIAQGFKEVSISGDQATMTELDAASFALQIDAADNRFAARALTSVKGLSRRFWVFNSEQYGDMKRMALAHSAVAEAISLSDEEAASIAVSALIDYVEEFTLSVVGFDARSRKTG